MCERFLLLKAKGRCEGFVVTTCFLTLGKSELNQLGKEKYEVLEVKNGFSNHAVLLSRLVNTFHLDHDLCHVQILHIYIYTDLYLCITYIYIC